MAPARGSRRRKSSEVSSCELYGNLSLVFHRSQHTAWSGHGGPVGGLPIKQEMPHSLPSALENRDAMVGGSSSFLSFED